MNRMMIYFRIAVMTAMTINVKGWYVTCIILIGLSFSVSSQNNDFGTWWGVEVRKKLPHDLRISLEAEARLNENSNRLKNIYIEPSLQYKPLSWLKLSTLYRFDNRYQTKGNYFTQRHRIAFNIGFEYPIKRFEFEYRNRTQLEWENIYSAKKSYPKLENRNMIAIGYKWPNLPLRTTIDTECWIPIEVGAWLSRIRASATQEVSLGKMHKIQARFIFQSQLFRSEPLREYIFSLKYVLTIN